MKDQKTLSEVMAELKTEMEEKLPQEKDIKVFKNGNPHAGNWTAGHYQLVHKSLPDPVAPVARPIVPKKMEAVFGIWDGKKLKPTQKMDISLISETERLRLFNEAHLIGQEVRYFVSNNEVQASELRPGQPYSVYPKMFSRTREAEAKVTDKADPVRVEGPFIHIQWMVLSETREQTMLPVGSTVAEEISLLQLWKKYIENRCRASVKKNRWGKHYRKAVEIEEGEVTSLQEGDGVEVIIVGKEKQDDRIEVPYATGMSRKSIRSGSKEMRWWEMSRRRLQWRTMEGLLQPWLQRVQI
jgi:hypothetical protein